MQTNNHKMQDYLYENNWYLILERNILTIFYFKCSKNILESNFELQKFESLN